MNKKNVLQSVSVQGQLLALAPIIEGIIDWQTLTSGEKSIVIIGAVGILVTLYGRWRQGDLTLLLPPKGEQS